MYLAMNDDFLVSLLTILPYWAFCSTAASSAEIIKYNAI